LEPYVEVSIDKDVVIEPERIKKWSPGMYKAYIELDPKYKKIGVDVADILEDGIKKILKGKNKTINRISPYDKKILEEAKSNLRKENKLMMEMVQRRKEIKKKKKKNVPRKKRK